MVDARGLLCRPVTGQTGRCHTDVRPAHVAPTPPLRPPGLAVGPSGRPGASQGAVQGPPPGRGGASHAPQQDGPLRPPRRSPSGSSALLRFQLCGRPRSGDIPGISLSCRSSGSKRSRFPGEVASARFCSPGHQGLALLSCRCVPASAACLSQRPRETWELGGSCTPRQSRDPPPLQASFAP